jgi:hypothetical protein
MDNKVYVSVNSSTANPPSHVSRIEQLYKIIANSMSADVAVRCAICEEYTPMNSNDYRAKNTFVCDKCKNAVLHIRALLENGGSVT